MPKNWARARLRWAGWSGVYALFQLISGPLLGRMSDHMGRKPLLIVSQIGTLIGFLITAFARNAVVGVPGANHRRRDGRQSFAGASLHLRRDQAGGAREIFRHHRHRVWNGISDRTRDLRLPGAVRLSLSRCCRGGAVSFTSILATTFLLPSVATRTGCSNGPADPADAAAFADPMGRIRRLFPQAGTGPAAVAIPGVRVLLRDVRFRHCRCSPNAVSPGTANRSGRSKPATCGRIAGFLGILLQGPALGRLVKRFGERALNRTGFAAYVAGYAMLAFCHSIPWLLVCTTVLAIGGLVRPTLTSMITQPRAARRAGSGAGADAIADFGFADRRAAARRVFDPVRFPDARGGWPWRRWR